MKNVHGTEPACFQPRVFAVLGMACNVDLRDAFRWDAVDVGCSSNRLANLLGCNRRFVAKEISSGMPVSLRCLRSLAQISGKYRRHAFGRLACPEFPKEKADSVRAINSLIPSLIPPCDGNLL